LVAMRLDVEEEQSVSLEAHAEEGTWWRWTWRRVHGGEMRGLGFRGSGIIKKKNSSDGHDDVINVRLYI
jgi:hypothetical protein